jgi:DNA-binding beta-propeller fold protein YncE
MTRPPSGRLIVISKDDRRLEVIDLRSGRTVGRVTLSGRAPHEVTVSHDGRYAVSPIYGDATVGTEGSDGRAIDVVDLVGMRLVRTIRLDFPSRPHDACFAPDGRLLVSTELDDSVSVIDVCSGRRTARLPTGSGLSHMFALSRDGSKAFVANVRPGTMSVVDVSKATLLHTVRIADEINRISLSPDGRTAFVADQLAARIALVDLERFVVRAWLAIPDPGFGTAPTPDGKSLIVAMWRDCSVGVVDIATGRISGSIPVPAHPQGIALDGSGRFAYTACDADSVVVEIDLRSRTITRTFATGRRPDGISWAGPLDCELMS